MSSSNDHLKEEKNNKNWHEPKKKLKVKVKLPSTPLDSSSVS